MSESTISGAAAEPANDTIGAGGASTVTSSAGTATAKQSILARVEQLLAEAESAIEHDAEALGAWIKAHL